MSLNPTTLMPNPLFGPMFRHPQASPLATPAKKAKKAAAIAPAPPAHTMTIVGASRKSVMPIRMACCFFVCTPSDALVARVAA